MSKITDQDVSFSLEVNVEPGYTTVRRLQTLIYRTLGLFRRMGLPEKLDEAISKVQRFIMVVNQARLAVIALNAASGPIGWGLALIGVGATAYTTFEMIEIERREKQW